MDEVAHQSNAEDHEIKHPIRAQGSPKVHLALRIVLCDVLDAVKNPKKRGCVLFFQVKFDAVLQPFVPGSISLGLTCVNNSTTKAITLGRVTARLRLSCRD